MAGESQFPLLIARAARENGIRVYAAAHEGETDPKLGNLVEDMVWIKLGQIQQILDFFKDRGIGQAVMAGGLTKKNIFRNFQPDSRCSSIMARLPDLSDDLLLRAMADEFEKEGVAIRPSTLFTPQLLAPEGLLTSRRPNERESADIDFGWRIAGALGDLDIGQCVVVRDMVVLALEAIEGTDETIRRGGGLGREKAVVVKRSKPGQDLRFDLPAVGLKTISVMAEVKASALAIEAGRTLIFDIEDVAREADRAGIAVLTRKGDWGA